MSDRDVSVNESLSEEEALGFLIFNESYYSEACGGCIEARREIMIGRYFAEGGCQGEFGVRWGEMDTPRMEMYGDAMHLLAEYPKFFARLGEFARENDSFDENELKDFLEQEGLYNLTSRVISDDREKFEEARERQRVRREANELDEAVMATRKNKRRRTKI